MPLVSIIIPHFNRAGLIAATLDSVRKQSFDDWEVIIVDDGSDALEYQRLLEYANSRIRVTQRTSLPKGPSKCRNIGLEMAGGVYVMFLDSDDLLASWSLMERCARATELPDLDFWVFHYSNFKETPGDVCEPWRRMDVYINHLERFLSLDGPWCVSSALWKRDRLIALGGFNERIWYGDDAELHIHALLEKFRFKEFPEVLPDCFVRRSDVPRATNELSDNMVKARLVYLEQVSDLIARYPEATSHWRLWKTTYFAEAEFLIFKKKYADVSPVLDRISAHFDRFEAWNILLYFRCGLLWHPMNPLAFRLWRKFYGLFLPASFFQWTQRRGLSDLSNLQWAALQDSLNALKRRANETMPDDSHQQQNGTKRKIKIWFTDFWGGFDPRDNWFISFLSTHFEVDLSEQPDFLIYSCYGTRFLRYNCVRIYFTAENIRPDYRFCDYSFSFDFSKDPRNYRLPLYRLYFSEEQLTAPRKQIDLSMLLERKFCNMVVSNAHARERIEFFELLSQRIKVDSGGKTLNNVGGPVENKRAFVHQYKFTIAFENSSYPGYLTEKLFEPWMERSVPIYWGDPRVEEEINPDCFINVMNFATIEEAVEEVLWVHRNPGGYLKYVQAPLFKNNVMPDYLRDVQIMGRFSEIFSIGNKINKAATWWHWVYYYVRKLRGGSRLIKMDLR